MMEDNLGKCKKNIQNYSLSDIKDNSNKNNNKNKNKDENKEKGVSGSTLKIIAIVTMLIDHIAFGIIYRYMVKLGYGSFSDIADRTQWYSDHAVIYYLYVFLRAVGRVSFPIFCFLLIEGFIHTSNKFKYGLRLFIFSFISEIPFDLAFFGTPFYMDYQNVYFTLFLGYAGLCVIDRVDNYIKDKNFGLGQLSVFAVNLVRFIIMGAFCLLASFIKTDYSAMGVLTIFVMYHLRYSKLAMGIGGCITLIVSSLSEVTSLAILPFMIKYNGKRGLKIKYLFYIFYPAHLFIIYLFNVWAGYSHWFIK